MSNFNKDSQLVFSPKHEYFPLNDETKRAIFHSGDKIKKLAVASTADFDLIRKFANGNGKVLKILADDKKIAELVKTKANSEGQYSVLYSVAGKVNNDDLAKGGGKFRIGESGATWIDASLLGDMTIISKIKRLKKEIVFNFFAKPDIVDEWIEKFEIKLTDESRKKIFSKQETFWSEVWAADSQDFLSIVDDDDLKVAVSTYTKDISDLILKNEKSINFTVEGDYIKIRDFVINKIWVLKEAVEKFEEKNDQVEYTKISKGDVEKIVASFGGI